MIPSVFLKRQQFLLNMLNITIRGQHHYMGLFKILNPSNLGKPYLWFGYSWCPTQARVMDYPDITQKLWLNQACFLDINSSQGMHIGVLEILLSPFSVFSTCWAHKGQYLGSKLQKGVLSLDRPISDLAHCHQTQSWLSPWTLTWVSLALVAVEQCYISMEQMRAHSHDLYSLLGQVDGRVCYWSGVIITLLLYCYW